MQEIETFVSHLECSYTGKIYPADRLHGLSEAGKPLLVRYDLEALSQAVTKEDLADRLPEFWRYREFLPIRRAENIVRLGELITPILPAEKLQNQYECGEILIKDEGRLPTGSFKARGLALAVAMAKELGVQRMAMPTNGNAGAALAAYCSAADIETYVFCPEDTPRVNIEEIAFQGAKTFLANGYINDCGKIVGEGKEIMNWFDASTLKEPYRIEGKKTMGLELAEQLDWELPDVILYPTGGGTGLIGMWKAFQELEAIGWIGSKRPRMVAVQAEGCAPIVKAFDEGTRHAEPWKDAHTIASGIRVPAAVGDFLILDAVRESDGFAVAVSDEDIDAAHKECAKTEGILLCPEGAATLAALKQELKSGRIRADENVMLFNCATGLKYPMESEHHNIDLNKPIDYDFIRDC
ncbi:MAG: threonine synthase [Gammaproteobacteria bacterium]|jgi:threonine synthase|nr:threonine synthase [Gammaproteobacteria bacterium]MBT3860083.1 threonine synthase [Gammaproteobacteria bacterium]MBT3987375.1 threonine synthase [Gammaproteobacteria bacterium]MBT4257337.1 threonine synthase [Gammaproteobacteria bacterium]MBT4581887.1 threonine synthase [Gammaproteobacteria bacterium]